MLHLLIHVTTLDYETDFTITSAAVTSETETHTVIPGSSDSPSWEAAGLGVAGGNTTSAPFSATRALWSAYHTRPGTCTVIIDIPAGIANPSACIGATVTLWAGETFGSALYSLSFTCTEASSVGRLVLVADHTEASAAPFVRSTETVPGEAAQEGSFYLHRYEWNGGSPPDPITHRILGSGHPRSYARCVSWLPEIAADGFGKPGSSYGGNCPFPPTDGGDVEGALHSYAYSLAPDYNSDRIEDVSGFLSFNVKEAAFRTSEGESWWTDYPGYIPVSWAPVAEAVLTGEARVYQVALSAYDAPPAPRQWIVVPEKEKVQTAYSGSGIIPAIPGYVLTVQVAPHKQGFICFILVYIHPDKAPYTPMSLTAQQIQGLRRGAGFYLSGTFTPYTAPTVSPVTL